MSHFKAASWVGIWTLPSFILNEGKQGDHLRHFSIFIKLCLSLFFVKINSGLCLSSCGPAIEYRFKNCRHSSLSTRSIPKSLALRACSVLSKRNPLVFAFPTPDFLLPPHWLRDLEECLPFQSAPPRALKPTPFTKLSLRVLWHGEWLGEVGNEGVHVCR